MMFGVRGEDAGSEDTGWMMVVERLPFMLLFLGLASFAPWFITPSVVLVDLHFFFVRILHWKPGWGTTSIVWSWDREGDWLRVWRTRRAELGRMTMLLMGLSGDRAAVYTFLNLT